MPAVIYLPTETREEDGVPTPVAFRPPDESERLMLSLFDYGPPSLFLASPAQITEDDC
jgi:hypothetical protein